MRICQHLKRPVFEVECFPASELEHWSLFFSIADNKDKPNLAPPVQTVAESKQALRNLIS